MQLQSTPASAGTLVATAYANGGTASGTTTETFFNPWLGGTFNFRAGRVYRIEYAAEVYDSGTAGTSTISLVRVRLVAGATGTLLLSANTVSVGGSNPCSFRVFGLVKNGTATDIVGNNGGAGLGVSIQRISGTATVTLSFGSVGFSWISMYDVGSVNDPVFTAVSNGLAEV